MEAYHTYLEYANNREKKGDLEGVLNAYLHIIELEPEDIATHWIIAKTCIKLEKKEMAIKHFMILLEYYKNKGEEDKIIEIKKHLHTINPNLLKDSIDTDIEEEAILELDIELDSGLDMESDGELDIELDIESELFVIPQIRYKTMEIIDEDIKETILVVDDEEANRALLEEIIYTYGYNVICAENSKAMYKILENKIPSLILLDVMLPDENGFQIAENLSKKEKLKDIPIIFVTAKTAPEDLKKGFDSGGVDYIKKPIDLIEMEVRIKAALQRRRLELKLKKAAVIDPLTDVYNKKYFFDIVSKQLEYIRRAKKNLAIIIIEIDAFKEINDNYGKQIGNNILKELANILHTNLRLYDLLARYAEERFAIMLSGCSKGNANKILQRVRNDIEKTVYNYKNYEIKFTISVGISDIKDLKDIEDIKETITAEELIKVANERLHSAKQLGGNNIVIEE